ncbi:MAG: ice-binding family protein [Bryobacteraceae bacterium]
MAVTQVRNWHGSRRTYTDAGRLHIGSSATLGTNTDFRGNILAVASIDLNTGATITGGRALALNGAVTLDTNTISNAGCAVPEPGTVPLLGAGLFGLVLLGRTSRKRAA